MQHITNISKFVHFFGTAVYYPRFKIYEDLMNLTYIIIAIVVIALIAFFVLRSKKPEQLPPVEKAKPEPKLEQKIEEVTTQLVTETPKPEPVVSKPTISFSERLKKGLSRSRQEVWGKLTNIFSGGGLDDEKIESLEELLYGADIGTATVSELMTEVQKKAKEGDMSEESFKTFLFDFLKNKMAPIQSKIDHSLYEFNPAEKGQTKVIMIVGVNGAGKTTTIGKLATKLRAQGASVVVGACDTFRAAAVDQLQVWCDRAGAKMIRAKEGSNPSGVGYDALQAALNEKADYCILDTAGRLHTKENLMDELNKSKNVLKKLDPTAPHQILLVIDAITGQNALRQAEEFHKTLDLTGLIFTKCDGSSKAGSAVSIVEQLKLPIAYIGVGETAEDLDIFKIDEYLKALLGM
jgi:fused signal recognition particle receptor